MTMRERLPAKPDSVDLSPTLELLASLTQYAEAGAVQPLMLAQAAQHAVDQHGDRVEILFAVAKLYLAAGERAEASRILGRAAHIAPEDQRVAQLLSETSTDPACRPAAQPRARVATQPSAPSAPQPTAPEVDTRVRRRDMASPPPATPRSATSPSSKPVREPAVRPLRAPPATPATPRDDVADDKRVAKQADTSPPVTPRSADPSDGPLLRPTVRMARVTQAPDRQPRWGKPGEGRDGPDSSVERDGQPPDGPRSTRGRVTTPAAVPSSNRDAAPFSRGKRAATGNLKLLDPNDERRHLDRYELIGEIASGGMASVFLARLGGVAGFQRFFAIKRLHPHLADEQEFIDMFLDEARLAAGIHHPNVVAILEVGTTEAGYYLVMDYVEGDTLSGVMGRANIMGGMPRPIALRIVLDTLHGLHAAHELTDSTGNPIDLVHRDCSPQNILVGIDGSSRITDFGVARASSRLSTTRSATVKGKLAYLSPEQATGRGLDRRSDLFGMGVILWEVLAGRRLFRADSDGATLSRILVEPIPPLTQFVDDIPEGISEVVATSLARDPQDRFATAADMADALEEAVRESGDADVFIASPREVSTFMRDLFSVDIAARRDTIRTWTAQSMDPPTSSGPRSQRFGRPPFSSSPASSPEPPSSRRRPPASDDAPGSAPSDSSPEGAATSTEPPTSNTEPSAVHLGEAVSETPPAGTNLDATAQPGSQPSPEQASVDTTLPAASSLVRPSARPLATTTRRPPIALLVLTLVLVGLAIFAYVLRSR